VAEALPLLRVTGLAKRYAGERRKVRAKEFFTDMAFLPDREGRGSRMEIRGV